MAAEQEPIAGAVAIPSLTALAAMLQPQPVTLDWVNAEIARLEKELGDRL